MHIIILCETGGLCADVNSDKKKKTVLYKLSKINTHKQQQVK